MLDKKELLNVKSIEDLMKIAKENNLETTKEEVEGLFKKITSKELSENELENIAGGKWRFTDVKAPEKFEKPRKKERFTSI